MSISSDVVKPEDVRVGDTIRILKRDGDVEYTETLRVASSDRGPSWTDFVTPLGYDVTVFDSHNAVIYLVSRPETSPEVEAIVKALGVTYDVASTYHAAGVRIHD